MFNFTQGLYGGEDLDTQTRIAFLRLFCRENYLRLTLLRKITSDCSFLGKLPQTVPLLGKNYLRLFSLVGKNYLRLFPLLGKNYLRLFPLFGKITSDCSFQGKLP
jgi:hypothetical protein